MLKSAFCWFTLHNCITMHYTKNIKERPLVRSKECLLAKVVIANICMNSIAERMGAGGGRQGEVCWRGKRTSLLEK